MKYTLTINQKQALELGLTHVNQAIILQLIADAHTWADHIIVKKDVYYWTSRQTIAEELPLLNLKYDTIYRHLKTLQKINLIDYIKVGKKDCCRLTQKGKTYYVGNKSELELNSEINPTKLGNKSENHSEINPTYHNTNLIRATRDPLSAEKNKEREINFKKFKKIVSGAEGFEFRVTGLDYLADHAGFQIQNGYIFSLQNDVLVSSDEAYKIWSYLFEKKDDVLKLCESFKTEKRLAS